MGRRRQAAALVAVGICIVAFSIVAEGIGLGSGNGSFGTWQQTGVAVGLVTIVGGAVRFSPPERLIASVEPELPAELFKPRPSDAWFLTGLAGTVLLGAGLVLALAVVVPLFNGDPIDNAVTCGELETAKTEALSEARAGYDAIRAEVAHPGSLHRPPTLPEESMSRYRDRKWELGCLRSEL